MCSPASIIAELNQNAAVFQALLQPVTSDQVRWKPAPDKWCLLEVVCHLYDEEREDFRNRTRHVLETPLAAMAPINPAKWVADSNYMDQDFDGMCSRFLEERKTSVSWLQSLKSPNWDNAYVHPKFGSLSARMFLSNWLAHDYFHFRQITRLKYAFLKETGGQPLDQAGPW
jgi:hypothetical protein